MLTLTIFNRNTFTCIYLENTGCCSRIRQRIVLHTILLKLLTSVKVRKLANYGKRNI